MSPIGKIGEKSPAIRAPLVPPLILSTLFVSELLGSSDSEDVNVAGLSEKLGAPVKKSAGGRSPGRIAPYPVGLPIANMCWRAS